ncbi:hypothetical protein Baya_15550 [Bagarius yarrelli]|uniref:Uncharacterized protein n=1 Tax=Bagarius yarrelli TaxID=175774 RepID=A0A556VBX1_BAGYA|nr:hypothetical protein Baya_15550 [Bagarius yarrelli]
MPNETYSLAVPTLTHGDIHRRLQMENAGVNFPEHIVSEDRTGFSSVPLSFSYTPFSVQTKDTVTQPLLALSTSRRRAEPGVPSTWGHDFGTPDVPYHLF